MLTRPKLLILSFLAAFCSLIYELILAQILAATLGGSLLRYCTVIGLFSLSLGLGSLVFGQKERSTQQLGVTLLKIEIILSAIGIFGPLAIILLDPFRTASSIPFIWEVAFYLPVVAVGFFSGFELPLLLGLGKNRSEELQLLSADYIGMFAGSLAVPFIVYPLWGPFLGSIVVGLMNLVAGLIIYFSLLKEPKLSLKLNATALAGLVSIAVALIIGQKFWLGWIQEWFIA